MIDEADVSFFMKLWLRNYQHKCALFLFTCSLRNPMRFNKLFLRTNYHRRTFFPWVVSKSSVRNGAISTFWA